MKPGQLSQSLTGATDTWLFNSTNLLSHSSPQICVKVLEAVVKLFRTSPPTWDLFLQVNLTSRIGIPVLTNAFGMMPTFLSKTFLSFQGGMIQMRASTRCQLAGMISARESKQDICSWHIKSLKCIGFFFQMVTTTDTSKAFYIIALTVFNPLLAFISIEIYIFNLVRFPRYLPSSNFYYEDSYYILQSL